jgi:DNA modification methylase
MANKSHFNKGHIALNRMKRDDIKHKSFIDFDVPDETRQALITADCLDVLRQLPDNSVQLILLDPPYNLDMSEWDTFNNYIEWASVWLNEAYRVLSPNGSCVIFGGTQFQDVKSGDLIEIIHYTRHHTDFRLVNTIVWYYKNGMSAHRYFANRHEEVIWLTKTDKYYFDLDSVRTKYDEETIALYMKDKRLNPENVVKGKNPTNVWEIGRLNGNSKERVGHPTQKPLEIVRRLVKALSYPGALVLDFFAGSGTTGRVCIEEDRDCIMVDKDTKSVEYFEGHLELMRGLGIEKNYSLAHSLEEFSANATVTVPQVAVK